MKPIKAATIKRMEDLYNLRYPLIGLIKLDGVRVILHKDLGPVTQTLKPIKNRYLSYDLNQAMIEFPCLVGCECELIVAGGQLADAVALVSTHEGVTDKATLMIFDRYGPEGFNTRMGTIMRLPLPEQVGDSIEAISLAKALWFYDGDEVAHFYKGVLHQKHEGVILREPEGLYKHGRSTIKEQGMMKLKPIYDAEAEIIQLVEGRHNANKATTNKLGYTERSTCKKNMVPNGMLGAFEVIGINGPFEGLEFKVPAGKLTHDLRRAIWLTPNIHEGKILTFTYKAVGSQGRPHQPVFERFRDINL